MTTNSKPLGGIKAYGSTPHLIGSRLGPGEHHIAPGQHAICTERARDRHDRIIVTEKLDGSNVAVARMGDRIIALGRSGYPAITSPYEQHRAFAWWVEGGKHVFKAEMIDGDVLHLEWMAQAHGTRYTLPHGPAVVIALSHIEHPMPDIEKPRLVRKAWNTTVRLAWSLGLPHAHVLSDGPPVSIERARELIAESRHGAIDPVEGAIWRVERAGESFRPPEPRDVVDFVAKWVDPTKVDGKYLPEMTGGDVLWNVRPGLTAEP